MSNKMFRYKCRTCGSEDIVADAYAAWDYDMQDWYLVATYDATYCNQCEGECRVNEVEDVPSSH